MGSGVEDEFAPGAPPPPNRWEGRAVGFCDEDATVDSERGSIPHPPSGWDGGVVGFCGDAVGEGKIEVGAKRGPFVLDEEVEQAKKRAKNSNAVRRAGVGARKLQKHLREVGVGSNVVDSFWELPRQTLRDCISDWIRKMRGAKVSVLAPRAILSCFNALARFLLEVAGINLREAEPFKTQCINALGNRIRPLQGNGAAPGERACLSRGDYGILCSRARDKHDALHHFRRMVLSALPLIGKRGLEGLRRVRSADFVLMVEGDIWHCNCVETHGKGGKAQRGGLANANARPRGVKLFDVKKLGICNPFERSQEHLHLISLAPLEGSPFFRNINYAAREKEKHCKRSPMGHKLIAAIAKGLRKLADLGGKGRTNHTLRPRMIFALDARGCDTEIIAKRSGRKSSAGAQPRMRDDLEAEISQQQRLTKPNDAKEEGKKVAPKELDAKRSGSAKKERGLGGKELDAKRSSPSKKEHGLGGETASAHGPSDVGAVVEKANGGSIFYCAFSANGGAASINLGGQSRSTWVRKMPDIKLISLWH